MTSEVKVWIVAGTSLALAGFCAVSSKLLKKSVGKKTLLSIEPDSLWTAIIWALQFAALSLFTKTIVHLYAPTTTSYWYPLSVTPSLATAPGYFLISIVAFCVVFLLWRTKSFFEMPDLSFLCVGWSIACVIWTSLAATNGGFVHGVTHPFEKVQDYYVNVDKVKSVALFLRDFTRIAPSLSMHGQNHPPGPILFLYYLRNVFDGNLLAVCLGAIMVSALTVVPVYLWAKLFLDTEGSRKLCLLWLVTPSAALYGATSMDGVFMLFLSLPLYSFLKGLEGSTRSMIWSGVFTGISLAIAMFMTFMTVFHGAFFAVFAIGYLLLAEREKFWKAAAVMLVAGIVFCAVYFMLYLSTGFNVINCLRTAMELDRRFYPDSNNIFNCLRTVMETGHVPCSLRWYIGTRLEDLLDFATLSGVATAGLWSGIAIKLVTSRPFRAKFDSLLSISTLSCSLVILMMLLAGLHPTGETGRMFLFLLPFVLIPSVVFLHSRSYRDIFHDPVFQLVVLAFCQTLILEAVLDTWW